MDKVTIEDFMGIQSVTVSLERTLHVIAAPNGQGKSSLLRAIAACVGKAGERPAKPVRQGAEKAHILLDLGDRRIERWFYSDGRDPKVVVTENGLVESSAAKRLESMVRPLSFDPLAFAPETVTVPQRREQVQTLLKALGLAETVAEMDRKHKQLYDTRTQVNAEIKATENRLGALPPSPVESDDEVSVADLSGHHREWNIYRMAVASFENQLSLLRSTVSILGECDARILKAVPSLTPLWQLDLNAADAEIDKLSISIGTELQLIESQMDNAAAHNEAVKRNREIAALREELAPLKAKVIDLEDQMQAIAVNKRELVANADLPVAGLTFDEDGLYLNGLPLEQAPRSMRMRIGLELACRMADKDLPLVLMDNGESLDDTSLDLCREIAERCGVAVLLARVGGEDKAEIVLRDGRAVSVEELTVETVEVDQ